MELTFQYEADGKRYTMTVEPQRPGRLEDDELEPMLYDPYGPSRAMMLDDLPGSPLDERELISFARSRYPAGHEQGVGETARRR